MVTCAVRLPAERYRTRASWSTTWLKPLWAKPRNWISATGTQPAIASPIAAPAITPSESGVSMTRLSPYLSYRPSVARNTPPVLPTSSPKTSMRSSRAISSASAWFTASTMVSSGIAVLLHARELTLQAFGRTRVHRAEEAHGIRRGLLLRLLPRHAELLAHVLLDALEARVVDDAFRLEVALNAQQRVAVDPQVVHLLRLVASRVVGGGVQPEPVGDGLDESRTFAGPRALDRVADDRIHREQVVAVDAHARKNVRDRLLREGLGRGLPLDGG